MEQMQQQPIQHLLQVYPSVNNTKPTNTHIIHISQTTQSLQIPVTAVDNQSMMTQNQIVMSCQQHIQNIPLNSQISSQIPSQVIQSSDMTQSLHVLLPQVPVFKQHMLVNGVQQSYYGQYDYTKGQCILTKMEPEVHLMGDKITTKESVFKPEVSEQNTDQAQTKKSNRNFKPNPSSWACNVRKQKHQRGEAYISRRGKYVPERQIKNTKDCLRSCKYKCSEQINDTDRENIFKGFYSLNSNEKKLFILNTTERNIIKHTKVSENHKRKHTFKYFFQVKLNKFMVCKNFYLGTLAISQKPVYNVHSGKSDMNIPKPDGRGLSEASSHALPSTVKDKVRKHITSFATLDSKPIKQFSRKKQYLDPNLSVKQMFILYANQCAQENMEAVKESMYRKIFKQEFNLHFTKTKEQLCCKCKKAMKKK